MGEMLPPLKPISASKVTFGRWRNWKQWMTGMCGKDVLLVARPPSKVGYATIEVGELELANPNKIAFAYRTWRIVKGQGKVLERYRKD